MIGLKNGTLIDKIGLQDGEIVEIKNMNELFEKQILVNNTMPTSYITHTGQEFSYLKLPKNKWIHSFRAGGTELNIEQKRYVNMQLGIYDEETQNLHCNTVDEYKNQLVEVEEYLEKEYGIVASFLESKIQYIELNRTFYINYPFDDYKRVLELIIAEMPKMNTISVFGKKVKNDNKEKIAKYQSYSAWNGKNKSKSKQYKQIIFYDKKSCLGKISLDGNIMRFELKLKGIKNIEKAFGSASFKNLTQEKVNSYFADQIEKLIVVPMQKWKSARNKYILKLIEEERNKDIQNWQVNVLRKLMSKEIEQSKPCILDVEELYPLIDRLKGLKNKSRIKRNFSNQANKYESVFCQNDDYKLEEIIDNLTQD